MYGSESWIMKEKYTREVQNVKMRFLRNIQLICNENEERNNATDSVQV